MPTTTGFIPFEPHPLLRNGHAQTLAGVYWPDVGVRLRANEHLIELDDGSRLSVWETIPASWESAGPAAILVHGLSGSSESSYIVRMAARLVGLGIRVLRINLRNAGSGFGLARGTYHAGRSDDLRATVIWLAQRLTGSPIAVVGFSLGGSLTLKMAAEAAEEPVDGLDCVLAASVPLDLGACARYLRRSSARLYDRNFVRDLCRDVTKLHSRLPELGPVEHDLSGVRSLYEFDAAYTAPRHGFAGVDVYYDQCSTERMLPGILVPVLIVQAEDDPFIPPEPFRRVECSECLTIELHPSGGHLGFISRSRQSGDRHWLDARLAAYLACRWPDRTRSPAVVSGR